MLVLLNFLSMLYQMFIFVVALVVPGEALRLILSRRLDFLRELDVLQKMVLDVYLGGLLLYTIAIVPLHLFTWFTACVVVVVSASFITFHSRKLLKSYFLGVAGEDVNLDSSLNKERVFVFAMFVTALFVQTIPLATLVFGSIHDTALHSLFVQVILDNKHVPVTLLPYATEGIVYPQGFQVMIAYLVYITGLQPPQIVFYATTLFSAMSVLGAYYLGKTLAPKNYLGISLAFIFAFVAMWPKYVTWGSNAFVSSIPLYFICLAFPSVLAKREEKITSWDLAFLGVLLGYLATLHLAVFEASMGAVFVLWLVPALRKHASLKSRLGRFFIIFVFSVFPIFPFYYRGLEFYAYPYHNIGVFPDARFTYPQPLSVSEAISFIYGYLGPRPLLSLVFIALTMAGIILYITKFRSSMQGLREVSKIAATTVGIEILITILWGLKPSDLPFYAQPIVFIISLYLALGGFTVYFGYAMYLFVQKNWVNVIKRTLARIASFMLSQKKTIDNPRVLAIGLTILLVSVPYVPFIVQTLAQDPNDIRGGFGVFAVTTEDDFALMSWMRENLPKGSIVLINPYESGTFIPSVSQLKIIFPPIASWHSQSYRRLVSFIQDGTLGIEALKLMKSFNITHVFIGGAAIIVDKKLSKWNPWSFLGSPYFLLIKKIGMSYLFSVYYPSLAISFPRHVVQTR